MNAIPLLPYLILGSIKCFNGLNEKYVRMVKSTMLDFIVLQCRYHYLSMFLTISQPPDLITEPATWHFNRELSVVRTPLLQELPFDLLLSLDYPSCIVEG